MMVKACAPALAAATARGRISVTLGESLARRGRLLTSPMAVTASARRAASVANSRPRSTLGQEKLASMATTPGTPSKAAARSRKSEALSPAMLTMMGTRRDGQDRASPCREGVNPGGWVGRWSSTCRRRSRRCGGWGYRGGDGE